MVSLLAAAGVIEKSGLWPVLIAPMLAVRFLTPARLMLRSLNVASPLASVTRVVVPLRLPLPLLRLMLAATPETLLPKLSCARTVTAGLMAAPAMALRGGWTKLRLAAAAGLTVMLLERALPRVPPVKVMVMLVAKLCAKLVKVTTPLAAVRLVVPCKAPLPALRAAVTVVELSEAIKLPNWSSILMAGCGAKATPAVATPGGWVKMVSLLAGAGSTVRLAEFVPPPRLGLLKWIVMVSALL